MKFKVGDIVESTEDSYWMMGRIAYIDNDDLDLPIALEVHKTKTGDFSFCHRCRGSGFTVFDYDIGYWVSPTTTKLTKEYIVKQIIKDL